MRKFLFLAAAVALLCFPRLGAANIDPDDTKYDPKTEGSWHTTFSFPATGDTIVWIGFPAYSGLVSRIDADCIVDPIELSSPIINPAPTSQTNRSTPNPRLGQPIVSYGPDTLTSATPDAPYCCGGLMGFGLTGLGTAGTVRISVTGFKTGGLSGGGGGGGAAAGAVVLSDIWAHMTDLDEHPDTALAVDQLVYPEDLGITEALLGTQGVTLTSGTWTTTSAFDTREADIEALYCSWTNDFVDSVQIVQRGGPSVDVTTHAGMRMSPVGHSPADSTITYFLDNGGVGGYAWIPLKDRVGNYLWSPYKSWGFLKIGTGNVTAFKAYYVWRRKR